ncbi:hypothetical protein [Limnoglobus roseus]|uniref:Uncharacterized protein n=1 Tax=Limnoglobus roseus TaxID=2598579 RepID=A0A5C1AC90_9BACT|nr:hypothetical protein [Limnoglobus roseus]QEL15803.1 hypothetical protein PX52LOC_02739 [Limnoglobus roseus]
MDDKKAEELRVAWSFAVAWSKTIAGACQVNGSTDPATWTTARANRVVAELKTAAQSLVQVCRVLEQKFPTTNEMSAEDMLFLANLGVPVKTIAEQADVSRPTVYSMIREIYPPFGDPSYSEE